MTSKTHALFCSILYIFAINIKKWIYYIQRYESNNMKNWKIKVNVSLLFSQLKSFSSQLFVVIVNDFLLQYLQSIKSDRLIKIRKVQISHISFCLRTSFVFAFISSRLSFLLWNFQSQQQRVTIFTRCQWISSQCRSNKRNKLIVSKRNLKKKRK